MLLRLETRLPPEVHEGETRYTCWEFELPELPDGSFWARIELLSFSPNVKLILLDPQGHPLLLDFLYTNSILTSDTGSQHLDFVLSEAKLETLFGVPLPDKNATNHSDTDTDHEISTTTPEKLPETPSPAQTPTEEVIRTDTRIIVIAGIALDKHGNHHTFSRALIKVDGGEWEAPQPEPSPNFPETSYFPIGNTPQALMCDYDPRIQRQRLPVKTATLPETGIALPGVTVLLQLPSTESYEQIKAFTSIDLVHPDPEKLLRIFEKNVRLPTSGYVAFFDRIPFLEDAYNHARANKNLFFIDQLKNLCTILRHFPNITPEHLVEFKDLTAITLPTPSMAIVRGTSSDLTLPTSLQQLPTDSIAYFYMEGGTIDFMTLWKRYSQKTFQDVTSSTDLDRVEQIDLMPNDSTVNLLNAVLTEFSSPKITKAKITPNSSKYPLPITLSLVKRLDNSITLGLTSADTVSTNKTPINSIYIQIFVKRIGEDLTVDTDKSVLIIQSFGFFTSWDVVDVLIAARLIMNEANLKK